MAKTAKNNAATKKYAYMKKRIRKAHRKSRRIGFLYLLATIALAAAACLQLVTVDGATLGVMEFWKPFKNLIGGNVLETLKANFFPLVISLLYGIMLLIVVINVLCSIGKLGWLFKRKASKLYGFNRNMYAMDDMGKLFSRSFAAIVNFYLLIIVLAGGAKLQTYAYAVLGGGIFIHFVCGIAAGNVSLFTTEEGMFEEKREVGNFAPFVRNVLQLAVTAAVAFFFVKCNTIPATVQNVIDKGVSAITADPMKMILPALELVILIWTMLMVSYATGNKEFDPEGAEASGRKCFLLLALLTLLTAGGAFAYGKFVAKVEVSMEVLYIAIIAFVAFVLELLLVNRPKLPVEKETDDVDASEYITENYDKPGVYITPPQPVTAPQNVPTAYTQWDEPVDTKKKNRRVKR